MSSSYTNLMYHIVFGTKGRRNLIAANFQKPLHEYLGGAVRGEGGTAIIVGGVAEHVHILARLRQDKAVSNVIRAIKANSSAWLKQKFPALSTFAWQRGYGAFTVSQSRRDHVRRYIEGQAEHHRQISFEEEFIALLKAHHIEFDERYLWD